MRVACCRSLFALALFATSVARAQHKSKHGAMAEVLLVDRLGSRGNDDVADIKQLARSPRESARILIDALHTIPDSEEFRPTGTGCTKTLLSGSAR